MSGGMSAWGIAAMAASTAMSMIGQAQQGAAQKKAANAPAQQVLNDGAYRADAAKQQAEKIRKAGAAQQGEAKASLAASGVKLGEGTALEVQKTIDTNVEEDALSALLSGKRITDSSQQEAKLLGKAGDNAVTNSVFGAGATMLKAGWKTTAIGRETTATGKGD